MERIRKFKDIKNNAWFVGGCLRDLFLKMQVKDVDVVVSGRAKMLAEKFAEINGGSFVVLDEVNRIYRIVLKDKTYDFSQIQGKNILEDLSRRDFTINSIALPADSVLSKQNIIDPFDGYGDLKNKVIRCVKEKNFKDDPLRVLRAFRFSGQLNFRIENNTKKSIKKYSGKLISVSPERIRNELILILDLINSRDILYEAYKYGLLRDMLPELVSTRNTARCYYPGIGLLGHSFETVGRLEKFYSDCFIKMFPGYASEIKSHLEGDISGAIKRKSLLKFAALLHDVGKPASAKKIEGRLRFFAHEDIGSKIIADICRRLKFSNSETKYLQQMTKHHMRLGNLTSAEKLTDKAAWRYFRDLGEDAIDLIVLSVADAYTYPRSALRSKHKDMANQLFKKLFCQKKTIAPKKFLDGNEVMKILKIKPGPTVGEILEKLEEAQVTKKVSDKTGAKEFIKHIYKNKIV